MSNHWNISLSGRNESDPQVSQSVLVIRIACNKENITVTRGPYRPLVFYVLVVKTIGIIYFYRLFTSRSRGATRRSMDGTNIPALQPPPPPVAFATSSSSSTTTSGVNS